MVPDKIPNMSGAPPDPDELPRQAHDRLFKLVCSTPDAALAVVRAALGERAAIVDEVDPGSFQPAPPNEVDELLGEDFRDLVFSCRLRGRETLIFFLVEHSRRPPPDMPLRSYDYVRAFWRGRRLRAPGEPLPPALAIVVHQGERPWSGPLSIADLIDAPPGLLEQIGDHVPGLRLALLDLGDRSPAAVAALEAPALVRVAFTLMRMASISGVEPAQVLEVVRVDLALSLRELMQRPGGASVLATVVRYTLAKVSGLEADDLRSAVSEAVSPEAGEVVMNTAQKLFEQGREEGLAIARKAVLNLLEALFGDLSDEVEERIQKASPDQLEAWSLRASQAKRLSDVFGPSASSGTKRRAKRSGGGRER